MTTPAALSIRTAREEDAESIAVIYNEGIDDRGATFETRPRTAADMTPRIMAAPRVPLLVAALPDGRVIGWASISEYRPRPWYAGVGEFSVYIAREARGQGVGKRLIEALVDAAREQGYWKLLSRIFTFNTASRELCRSCGFREVGIYEKHGRLDGRWLDTVIVERLIPENQQD